MCGIVAAFGNDSYAVTEVALSKIKHRGRDATKLLRLPNCVIGFNRLSINDKSDTAMQPFEFGNLVGAFNAEIYNAEELKVQFGLQTNSNADTEVILPLFEKIGSSIIHKLDGFYSGIIFNKLTKQVFTLRDYIGKKPLFFGNSENDNFIVSELKAIDFIDNFQIVPKGFSELKNGKISLIEQHQLPYVSKEDLKEQIVQAVIKRIPKNEKQFGIFLSGGLDSSIIASIVSKHAENVIYYTLGNTDDLNFANILSKKLGIETKIKKVELPKPNELSDLVDKIVYHTESYNPSIISNGLATYLLSKEAHQDGLKVVLSGEGADELFCGYTISKNVNEWFEKRTELIENMHFTELRRLDLTSMAHTIEIRCPFLDRNIFSISNDCKVNDLISDFQGKQILRKTFKSDLPSEIVQRNKMSFDVGSGIRKMVVEYLTQNGKTERERLKEIWSEHFQTNLSDNFYFHSYPTFDKAIEKRGVSHKINEIEKVESLLLQEFKTVPFHNLFMRNDKKIVASDLGGTCSDKVLHFKKVLSENGISSKLHSAFINGLECHRMLTVEIDNQKYFIDVGSGWASTKLFPAFDPIQYSAYGMTFKTELSNDNLLLFHKANGEFKLMITIPLKTKEESEILSDIEHRFDNKTVYPFQNSLRFSKVIGDSFYFIKGDTLRIYNNKGETTEKKMAKAEIERLFRDIFKFSLNGLEGWYLKPSIVTIIATKNAPHCLEHRSLKSVTIQRLYPDNIIVVDDSDNQDSIHKNKAIIEKFKTQTASRGIEYIQNRRTAGIAGSWNSAVDFLLLQKQLPENTFIAILDDTSEWFPDYLRLYSQSIESTVLDVVTSNFYGVINEKKVVNVAPPKILVNDFLVGDSDIRTNILIRLSCLLEAGCFDENLKNGWIYRDLCVRVIDLGYIRYKQLAAPLMSYYTENDSATMSISNTESKSAEIGQFWLKYSKRMTIEQQKTFQKTAKALFNWKLPKVTPEEKEVVELDTTEPNESYALYIGVICSSYKLVSCLIAQLGQLQHQSFISDIQVFLLENNLPAEDKSKINQSVKKAHLNTTFITSQMQDKWIEQREFFRNFSRNNHNGFSIAQARTMLQKYVGQVMAGNDNAIAWILDEDMQFSQYTLQGLKALPKLKGAGLDVAIGTHEHSSPNPPLTGIRTQLVDFWHNLCWLLNQNPDDNLPDISSENCALIKKYPDYYYDLSRKHFGHLEHPFWIKPKRGETVKQAIKRLCKDVLQIFVGYPLTRPLIAMRSGHILDSAKDSVNRGGNTFIFNADALNSTPNLSIKINGSDIRRSDMIWAIINKHYRKMNIKAVNIPIWHAGGGNTPNFAALDIDKLDINKLRDELLGSCLYAGLTDFLKDKPDHCLVFWESNILDVVCNVEQHLNQRMVQLRQTFYRVNGISKSIKALKKNKHYSNLGLTTAIDKVFTQKNFELLKQSIMSVDLFPVLSSFLSSMQIQSDNFQKTTIL